MTANSFEPFGGWIEKKNLLCDTYKNAKPFEHVVIPNFFNDSFVNELERIFPSQKEKGWYKYYNPIEKKTALNDFSDLPLFKSLFDILQSDIFVKHIQDITSISNLEKDPYLHGAGIHYHSTGGKLDMHLDYSVHPISQKERRVNLIIYLNKEWKEEYNGDIQLWNSEFTHLVKKIYPVFNTAVLFNTSDDSWHGLPTPIKCPPNIGRKSVAIYYVSDLRTNSVVRYKAQFRPLPDQPVNEGLKKLYDIRSKRIITKEDLIEVYPDWESEGNGFW